MAGAVSAVVGIAGGIISGNKRAKAARNAQAEQLGISAEQLRQLEEEREFFEPYREQGFESLSRLDEESRRSVSDQFREESSILFRNLRNDAAASGNSRSTGLSRVQADAGVNLLGRLEDRAFRERLQTAGALAGGGASGISSANRTFLPGVRNAQDNATNAGLAEGAAKAGIFSGVANTAAGFIGESGVELSDFTGLFGGSKLPATTDPEIADTPYNR